MYEHKLLNSAVFGQGFSGGGGNTLLSSFQTSLSPSLATEPGDISLCRESWDVLVQPAYRLVLIALKN